MLRILKDIYYCNRDIAVEAFADKERSIPALIVLILTILCFVL